jgi:MFS family permease
VTDEAAIALRPSLGHHRAATATAFAVQGLLFISLTTRLPRFQDRWDLSELAVSGLLLMVVLLAGAGSVVAGLGARRLGSGGALRVALLLAGSALAVVAAAPVEPAFVAGLAAYGLALGAIDATTNMQAVALEHRYERTILPTFHGAWTLGGIAATLVAIAVTGLGITAGLLPLALLGMTACVAPFLPHAADLPGTAPRPRLPWRRIGLLGAAMVLFYMVDTAATTWGPVFLRSAHAAPDWLLPMATLPYLVASGATRLGGDAAVARWGSVPLLRTGAVVAALALAVVVFSTSWWVAVLGFTLLGASVAVVAPLSFSAAAALAGTGLDGDDRRARVDAVVARFNQFNYVGGLLGAVLTGVVGSGSLRVGFALPMVLVLAILPLAGAFRVTP